MSNAPQRRVRAASALGMIAAGFLAVTGCSDKPICSSPVFVAITSPSAGTAISSVADTSSDPGIQVDVTAHSSLNAGDSATLTVTDASGAVAQFQATAQGSGDLTFSKVTLPSGKVTLKVSATSGSGCGTGSDTATVNVTTDVACALSIEEGPISNSYYDPIKVLNISNDSNPTLPGFQAHVDVATNPGYKVKLYVLDVAAGNEASAGTATASNQGATSFPVTLAQGKQAIRATCVSPGGGASGASATNTVFVDTVAPTCTLVKPPDGQPVIPSMDEDKSTAGTQITLVGHADGSDVDGESASFKVGTLALAPVTIAASGDAQEVGSFTSPGMIPVTFQGQDHAGNTCSAMRSVNYVTDGCSIATVAPTAVVTQDSDPSTSGLQTQLGVDVDTACAGQMMTTTCDITGTKTVTVPADGHVTLPITICSTASCQTTYNCTSSVTSTAGITTSSPTTIQADTQAPPVSLVFDNPSSLKCGDVIDPSADIDSSTPGVQIAVTAVSPLASSRRVEVTNGSSTTTFPEAPAQNVTITLPGGTNNIIAYADDQYGNEAHSTDPCNVTLADIAVSFDPPVSTGLLGSNDGSVSGANLTLDITGTVSVSGAAVSVTIDGGTAQAATTSGTSWSLPGVTLSEGSHTIVASAVSGMKVGSRTQNVTVDLTPPGAPTNLAATSPNRQSAVLTWTAPDGGGGTAAAAYIIKFSTTPLTASNFATTGTTVPGPTPGAPGSTDTVTINKLRAGTGYYFGVAAVDAAGNVSAPATTTNVLVPAFIDSGAISDPSPVGTSNDAFGYAMAAGDFNGDGIDDLAVGEPYVNAGVGRVYIYLGRPGGLSTAPDYVINGNLVGTLGYSLARVRWNNDATDDLAIGAPYQDNGNGHIYIFLGGARFAAAASPPATPATLSQSDADVVISASTANGDWFNGAELGFGLATTRFDPDGNDDLVIGAPTAGGGAGGAAVVFGGTSATSITLSSTSATGMNGAVADILPNPDAANTSNQLFGFRVFNLGRTNGAIAKTDDVAVSYQDNSAPTAVYVWRGRNSQPTGAAQMLNWNSSVDLGVVNQSADTTTAFGETVVSVPDGGGVRDIAIAAFRQGTGRVTIVDGTATGLNNIGTITLGTITGASGTSQFGNTILSGPDALRGGDVDGDGIQDLIIGGGSGSGNVNLYVWYGGQLPTGTISSPVTTTSASADYVIPAPAAFSSTFSNGDAGSLFGIWCGDVNGDKLGDICWSDYRGSDANGNPNGAFDVLFDPTP